MSKRGASPDHIQQSSVSAKRRLFGDETDSEFITDNEIIVEADDDPDAHSGDNYDEPGTAGESRMIREQDRFLPIANVSRIMKRVLPEAGKVAKEAKECVQECVSEFISFITSEASERCMREKRKTINGEDLLWAMKNLGFDPYLKPLDLYLSKYRMVAKGGEKPTAEYCGVLSTGSPNDPTSSQADAENDDVAPSGTVYVSQNHLIIGGDQQQHRQLRLTTNSNGQLTIFGTGDDARIAYEHGGDGTMLDQQHGGGTELTLPVLSSSISGGQQFILAGLDQANVAGGQQFALSTGGQVALLSTGSGTAGGQTIPVMFLDSGSIGTAAGVGSGASGAGQPQYISLASGNGQVQLIQLSTSQILDASSADSSEIASTSRSGR